MKKSQRNARKRLAGYKKCPVEIGNNYFVDITDITPNGTGIGRIQGFLILVPKTKVGDHVKVKINSVDSLSAEAEV
jgi:predicted RNA-binding protein with TRAM domain